MKGVNIRLSKKKKKTHRNNELLAQIAWAFASKMILSLIQFSHAQCNVFSFIYHPPVTKDNYGWECEESDLSLQSICMQISFFGFF